MPFYYGYRSFLMAALEKRRDALHILSLAEPAPTAEESIKKRKHIKGFSPFPLISNKGGPTGKGTQTGGNPCPPVHWVGLGVGGGGGVHSHLHSPALTD